MFSVEEVNQFGNNGGIEKLCAIVQPHFPKILHCLEGKAYVSDSRKQFLANVLRVELEENASLEYPWWIFGIIFHGNIAKDHVWRVSIFDPKLAGQLVAMCPFHLF